MKARGCLACLICVALAVLALPAAAGAKPASHKRPNLFQLHVNLPDSNGYAMEISAEDHHHVELTASRGAVAVHYSVLGRASSRRLDADFGTFGEAHIRIHLTPELVVPGLIRKKRCAERFGLFGGSFSGKVDFAGEPQVARVVTHRGRVAFIRSRRVCKHRSRRPADALSRSIEERVKPAEEVDQLSAELKAEGRAVSFEALRLKSGPFGPLPTTFVSANLSETLGRVTIDRSAFEITPEKILRVSRQGKQPETAVVEPAKPFAGSASYSAEPGVTPIWSGDLSVRLPGIGTVPLTGAGFSAKLCRGFSEIEEENCS